MIVEEEEGPPATQSSQDQEKVDSEKTSPNKKSIPKKKNIDKRKSSRKMKSPAKRRVPAKKQKKDVLAEEKEEEHEDEHEDAHVEEEPVAADEEIEEEDKHEEKYVAADERNEEEAVINDDDSEDSWNSGDEMMAVSSCDEDDKQYPEFNEVTGMEDPQFSMGMLFASAKVFREAVRRHAIHQRPIRLRKNLSDIINWVCAKGCDCKCYGTKLKRSENIQIKALHKQHACNPTWDQKCVNSTWIASKYEDELRINPTWPAKAFQQRVVNDLKCRVSLAMIYRAMNKAKENILGKHEAEYGQLFAYGNEVKKQMPTSTIKIMSEDAGVGEEGRRFKRCYVCLGPLKEGFLDGCRPIIGLDGCHLRGPLRGILLTAVGTDPNDGMYPLAWAQVEAENNDSWDWFIGLLKQDLGMENEATYTFISDRQKGLVNALESQVPAAEHRYCVMHMYRNLHKEHKGIGVRRLLWSAARATTDYFFNLHMNELKQVFCFTLIFSFTLVFSFTLIFCFTLILFFQIAPRAHDWLMAKPKSQWSRCAFREICKSDMFVNNNCEVFNNAINRFRDMGIVTMLKSIHTTCMERICKRLNKMEIRNTTFCTKPMKKLHK